MNSATADLNAPNSPETQSAVRCSDLLDRIFCADCLRILPHIWPDEIDLVVTSPPYGNLRSYGQEKLTWDFHKVADNLVRVLKPGGVIVWVVADETINGSESLNSFKQAEYFVSALGLKLWDTMIYGKNASSPNVNQPRYMQSSEYMFVMVKGDRVKSFNPIMSKNTTAGVAKRPYRKMQRNGEAKTYGVNAAKHRAEEGILSNIWIYNTGAASGDEPITFDHPAPFPLKLAKDHIASWSNPGDIVLDPFNGSGTTCKAAKELSRRWIGIDVNPDYCKIAEERLRQNVLQLEASHAV